jgi:hypothetical protein
VDILKLFMKKKFIKLSIKNSEGKSSIECAQENETLKVRFKLSYVIKLHFIGIHGLYILPKYLINLRSNRRAKAHQSGLCNSIEVKDIEKR